MSRLKINLICYLLLAVVSVNGDLDLDEEYWVDPDAWSEESKIQPNDVSRECVCPKVETCNKDLGPSDAEAKNQEFLLSIYKKFMAALFKKQKFEKDETNGKYLRILELNLTEDQIEMIATVKDPRDLDGILNQVLATSVTYSKQKWMKILETDNYLFFKELKSKCMQFLEFFSFIDVKLLMLFICVTLSAKYFQKQHLKEVCCAIIVTLFIYGFYVSYQTCQQKLEVDNLIKATTEPQLGYFESIQSIWRSQTENEKLAQKLRASQEKLSTTCRVDHVLIMYFNDLFLHSLKSLLNEYLTLVKESESQHGFFLSIVVGVAAAGLICFILKLMFEHVVSPKAWVGLFSSSPANTTHQMHPPIAKNEPEPIAGDRLSGANLAIILNSLVQSSLPNSGVETLSNTNLQQIQNGPAKKESKSNDLSESTTEESFEFVTDQEKSCQSKAKN